MSDQSFRGFLAKLEREHPREILAIEDRVDPKFRIQALITELERRGHRIRPADGSFGGYQAIMRNANGVYEAATEMRKDGVAGGY